MQQTLKVAHISQFSPIEGEFPSELHQTHDVCLCKIHIRKLPKEFFNNKHVNLSLLEDFYPLLVFKKHLVIGPEKKRNTVSKNAPIIALDDL